ncbi:hypothetical protein [Kineococcus indalonis]|uniref:hypothetical protein n=1 Tax=Kineococcus indalonis TaxID=2696566 RepID=UPI001411F9A8|nr:hypothetical protein [Kineococcus indalonis]NAZ87326.1 hypothetical protein [Kineococcus indalonis]
MPKQRSTSGRAETAGRGRGERARDGRPPAGPAVDPVVEAVLEVAAAHRGQAHPAVPVGRAVEEAVGRAVGRAAAQAQDGAHPWAGGEPANLRGRDGLTDGERRALAHRYDVVVPPAAG